MSRRRFFGDDFGPLNANEIGGGGPGTGSEVMGIMSEWIRDYDGSNNVNMAPVNGVATGINGSIRIDDRRALMNYGNGARLLICDVDPVSGVITPGTENIITVDPVAPVGGVHMIKHSANEILVFLRLNLTDVRVYSVIIGSGTTIASVTLVTSFSSGGFFNFGSSAQPRMVIRKHSATRYVVAMFSYATTNGALKLSYCTYSGGTFTVLETITYPSATTVTQQAHIEIEDENSGYFVGWNSNGAGTTYLYKYTLTPTNIVPGTNVGSPFFYPLANGGTFAAVPNLKRIRNNFCQLLFSGEIVPPAVTTRLMVDFTSTPIAVNSNVALQSTSVDIGRNSAEGILGENNLVCTTAGSLEACANRMVGGFIQVSRGQTAGYNNGTVISTGLNPNFLYPFLNIDGCVLQLGTLGSIGAFGNQISTVWLTKDTLLVFHNSTGNIIQAGLVRRT